MCDGAGIIRVKSTGYTGYEDLLIRRDKLRKEARNIELAYMAEFGDLVTAIFKLQIECIQKKKIIAYCQIAINKGNIINIDDMNAKISLEMQDYYRQLSEMVAKNEIARTGKVLSGKEMAEIKKLYHKLAKLIHPDINPKTNEIPELLELWQRIVIAYNNNCLEELKEAEVMATKILNENGVTDLEIEIPDLNDKISKVKDEIDKIKSTNPYLYKFILQDTESISSKHEELKGELEKYQSYDNELAQVVDMMTNGGGEGSCLMN